MKERWNWFGNSLLVILIAFFQGACKQYEKNKTHPEVTDQQIAAGLQLARNHCGSCHLLPDPQLLDSKSWEQGVLPAMAPRLGIFQYGTKEYASSKFDPELGPGFYPSQPVIGQEGWQRIIQYYSTVSPDSLQRPERKYPVRQNTGLFEVVAGRRLGKESSTCMVKFDTTTSRPQLLVGVANEEYVYRFDKHLDVLDSFQSKSPVVDLDFRSGHLLACQIGIMNPNNGRHGSIADIILDLGGGMHPDPIVPVSTLYRPVQVSTADFNNDGREDMLICEFGNLNGALSWIENLGGNRYERHVIRNAPGAIKAYLEDFNNDGLMDIWALFAQGEEGIFLFINKGRGIFEEKQLLRFQPVYGSSYFEFGDFNKDGFKDILYTCGDNADYSPVLKPYHGVYIFLNDGSNHFKQQYFFPMNGCFKAMARDFDGDGDLDIAAISFFADFENHPEESFLYLENKGSLDFQPYTIPGTINGRWLTMDASDIDDDGKIDLVLGNFATTPSEEKWSPMWKSGPPFIVLKNKMKK